ncbi:MAG: substrate-binding domain-containing protein, partial [Pseudomonadota bacterium]
MKHVTYRVGTGVSHIALAAVLASGAGIATAQAAETTLTIKNGGNFTVTGTLRDFDGKTYIIDSPQFGRMELSAARFDCAGEDCPQTQSKMVTLEALGGGFSISGDLEAFDETTFTISSADFGRMNVPAARFTCKGEGCPEGIGASTADVASASVEPAETLKIVGAQTLGARFMPKLLEAFGASADLTASKATTEDDNLKVTFANAQEREVAYVDVASLDTKEALQALQSDQSIIAMSSRAVTDQEASRFAAAGVGNMRANTHQHAIAGDGLLVVVSPDNPVVSLSKEELAK